MVLYAFTPCIYVPEPHGASAAGVIPAASSCDPAAAARVIQLPTRSSSFQMKWSKSQLDHPASSSSDPAMIQLPGRVSGLPAE